MKKKNWLILCLFVFFYLPGCSIDDFPTDEYSDDDTDDFYPADDSPTYSPPEYIPTTPPDCIVNGYCNSLMYSPQEEYADVHVTIQNTSKDEVAYDVKCDLTIKNGTTVLAQTSLNFGNISADSTITMVTTCTTMRPQNIYDEVECFVTWHDIQGNNYETKKSFQIWHS